MPSVFKRTWLGPGPKGRRVRKVSRGYTLQVAGKQIRRFSEKRSRDDAQNAFAERLLERDTPKESPKPKTLTAVIDEYQEFKRAKGKRSVRHDEYRLKKIKAWFGADTPITEVTAQRVAQYDRARVTEKSRRKRPVMPATVNRELSILRHRSGSPPVRYSSGQATAPAWVTAPRLAGPTRRAYFSNTPARRSV